MIGQYPLTKEEGLKASPPQRRFQWRNQDYCPYRNFEHEYYESPYRLDAATLKERWEGMVEPEEIDKFFSQEWIGSLRSLVCGAKQVNILREAGFDFSDPNFKAQLNGIFAARVYADLDRIESILEAGEIMTSKERQIKFKDADGNLILDDFGEPKVSFESIRYTRPLTATEIDKLEARKDEKIKLIRLLTEQATDIANNNVDVNVTLVGQIRSTLRDHDPEYARLAAIEEGRTQVPPDQYLPTRTPRVFEVENAQ